MLFASAVSGYVLMRRARPASALSMEGAFAVLDRAIGKYVPDLKQGYTWSEAFERLKESGVRADWDGMKERLEEYEAYRYGGKEVPAAGEKDIVSLATKLRRGVVGKGT